MLAAALRSNAQLIVTFNLKDFPAAELSPFGLEANHPDDFVLDLVDLSPGTVLSVVRAQAASLKNPPKSIQEVLDTLEKQVPQSVAKLRGMV